MPGQKRGQAFVRVRIEQALDSTLANAHQVCYRDGGVVECEGQWRAVKIATRNDVSALSEYKWIIGRGRGFDEKHILAMRQRAARGTVHLRHTTQAVGVLDTRIVLEMRLANLASFQNHQQMFGRRSLSRMRPRVLQPRIERGRGAFQRLETHRA